MAASSGAKRLLTDEETCYSCRFFEEGMCGQSKKKIPSSLICDNWRPHGMYVNWSKESALALKNFSGLDAGAELIKHAEEEMRKEIDKLVVDSLGKYAMYGSDFDGDQSSIDLEIKSWDIGKK